MQTLRRTALHARHAALGARLVPFAGWELPVQYAGIVEALYGESGQCAVEAQVRFEDGRTGTVRAQLAIGHAKTFAPAAARSAA